jgi:DNA-binding IclR family transcriptional regulator
MQYWQPIESALRASMPVRTPNLSLTSAQAACLRALRHGRNLKTGIALEAKLDLIKTESALKTLASLGLAKRNRSKKWRATPRGISCRYAIAAERQRRKSGLPGPGGQRLLALLDRPMRGPDIAEKLGLTHQRVRQLIVKLHAQDHVSFGDPANPYWMVMRASDKTAYLSRVEERVLSAIPREYVTNATKIRLAARVPENSLHEVLDQLVRRRLIEASEGLRAERVFRLTAAGLNHSQRIRSARRAQGPRLPVESERVSKVLSIISESGALRIKHVTELLRIPNQSINALMQYLKRKGLVTKTGPAFDAPYVLTDAGHTALAEMERRQAA